MTGKRVLLCIVAFLCVRRWIRHPTVMNNFGGCKSTSHTSTFAFSSGTLRVRAAIVPKLPSGEAAFLSDNIVYLLIPKLGTSLKK